MSKTMTRAEATDAINALADAHDLSVAYLAGYLSGQPCSCTQDETCPPCRSRAYLKELFELGVIRDEAES